MNREIKFRAWHKTYKKMFKIGQLTLEKGSWNYEPKDKEFIGMSIPYQPNFILMQYTGLKDKNGVEVYEGDKVMFDYEWTKPDEIGVITWNKDTASFQIKGHIPSSSMKHLDRMKVIGNVWDKNDC